MYLDHSVVVPEQVFSVMMSRERRVPRFALKLYRDNAIDRTARKIVRLDPFVNAKRIKKNPPDSSFKIVINKRKGGRGAAPRKPFLKALARLCPVVMMPELSSSKMCRSCGNDIRLIKGFRFFMHEALQDEDHCRISIDCGINGCITIALAGVAQLFGERHPKHLQRLQKKQSAFSTESKFNSNHSSVSSAEELSTQMVTEW